MSKPVFLCSICKDHLLSWDEQEFGICDDCGEVEIRRSEKRREWAYYHPGEPCPESELPTRAKHKEGLPHAE